MCEALLNEEAKRILSDCQIGNDGHRVKEEIGTIDNNPQDKLYRFFLKPESPYFPHVDMCFEKPLDKHAAFCALQDSDGNIIRKTTWSG